MIWDFYLDDYLAGQFAVCFLKTIKKKSRSSSGQKNKDKKKKKKKKKKTRAFFSSLLSSLVGTHTGSVKKAVVLSRSKSPFPIVKDGFLKGKLPHELDVHCGHSNLAGKKNVNDGH
jgi:hypothetical protein